MSNFKKLTSGQLHQVDRAQVEYGPDIIEIEGVVSENSQGGWPHSDGCKIHCFAFEAWRRPGEAITNRQLTILRPIEAQATDYFQDYPALSLQRFRFLLDRDEMRAILAGSATALPDATGLQEIAEELAKPVVFATERFGNLVLNRRIHRFEGCVEWVGKIIDVSFDPEAGIDIARALGVAETLWMDQQSWHQRIQDFAVQELLPTKNNYWLGDDETPLSAEQFKQRMSLEAITFDSEGNFEFWHDDGDLFYGHSIQVSGTLNGLSNADIPG